MWGSPLFGLLRLSRDLAIFHTPVKSPSTLTPTVWTKTTRNGRACSKWATSPSLRIEMIPVDRDRVLLHHHPASQSSGISAGAPPLSSRSSPSSVTLAPSTNRAPPPPPSLPSRPNPGGTGNTPSTAARTCTCCPGHRTTFSRPGKRATARQTSVTPSPLLFLEQQSLVTTDFLWTRRTQTTPHVLIKNARVWTGKVDADGKYQSLQNASLRLRDGLIVEITEGAPIAEKEETVVDAQGAWITPGIFDMVRILHICGFDCGS